jgi:hypothetical protein
MNSLEDARSVGPWSNIAYWLMFGVGLVWTAQICLGSTSSILDDEVGHYLFSRDSFLFPLNLLNGWGKPVNTLVYAVPAQGGLLAARLFSLLMSAATVLVATRLAAAVGVRYLFLVPALLWFQRWFNQLGFTVLTEVPFALWLTSGTFFWAVERYTWASCFASLLPLTRHEGIALTGLWFLYMLFRRDWLAAAITLLPTLAVNILDLLTGGVGYTVFLNPKPTVRYGQGDWLHFVRPLRTEIGTLIIIFAAVGAVYGAYWLKGRRRLVLGFVVYAALHTVLYRFGLFASGGYSFFLLPTAPAFAVAGAIGLESIAEMVGRARAVVIHRIPLPNGLRPAVVAVALFLVIASGLRQLPLRLSPDDQIALRQASDWLKAAGLSSRPTVSTNVEFYYSHGLRVGPATYWWDPPPLASLPEGAIVVWDRRYSSEFGLELSTLRESPGWRQLATFGNEPFAIVFEKRAQITSAKQVEKQIELDRRL